MNEKLPISCFIIALNEADRIDKTIKSVKDLVDEVIVIDSGSNDGTQKLAEDLGCKVFYNEWNGFGPQKRFGEECSKNKWLLNLDADEYLSHEISNEIRDLFRANLEANFFVNIHLGAQPWRMYLKNPDIFVWSAMLDSFAIIIYIERRIDIADNRIFFFNEKGSRLYSRRIYNNAMSRFSTFPVKGC